MEFMKLQTMKNSQCVKGCVKLRKKSQIQKMDTGKSLSLSNNKSIIIDYINTCAFPIIKLLCMLLCNVRSYGVC